MIPLVFDYFSGPEFTGWVHAVGFVCCVVLDLIVHACSTQIVPHTNCTQFLVMLFSNYMASYIDTGLGKSQISYCNELTFRNTTVATSAFSKH